MQIGIDLGATKIESVLLKENGLELHRDRIQSPKNYQKTISDITNIVNNIEKKFKKNLNVGICHPGSTNLETGFIQNAFNSPWLNNQTFSKDISKSLNRNVYCENDANCFALSEAFDGAAKNFKTVFGIILGSGCGGGLVINKKIIIGPNSFTGEWGHIPIGKPDSETNIEEYISGKGLERKFTARFNKNLSAHEIFKNAKDNSQDEIEIIDEFKKSSIGKNALSFEKMRIKETMRYISNCDLYIGNDTGWAHISVALKVKALTLFMDSPVFAYGRYSSRMTTIEPIGEKDTTTHDTLGKDKISFDEVYKKSIEMLN